MSFPQTFNKFSTFRVQKVHFLELENFFKKGVKFSEKGPIKVIEGQKN